MHRICSIKKRTRKFVTIERETNSKSKVKAFKTENSLNTKNNKNKYKNKNHKNNTSIQDDSIKQTHINNSIIQVNQTNDFIKSVYSIHVRPTCNQLRNTIFNYFITFITICFMINQYFQQIRNNIRASLNKIKSEINERRIAKQLHSTQQVIEFCYVTEEIYQQVNNINVSTTENIHQVQIDRTESEIRWKRKHRMLSKNAMSLEIPKIIPNVMHTEENCCNQFKQYIIILRKNYFATYYGIKNSLYLVQEHIRAYPVKSSIANVKTALTSYLLKLCHQEKCTDKLREVVRKMNSTIHATKRYSSYFLQYGKEIAYIAKKHLKVHRLKLPEVKIDDIRVKNIQIEQTNLPNVNNSQTQLNHHIAREINNNKFQKFAYRQWKSKSLRILLENLKSIHKIVNHKVWPASLISSK